MKKSLKRVKINYVNQGYSYVKCTKNDCFDWGGMAICDYCGEHMQGNIYLIFILGSAYCEKCFKDWINRVKKYDDDFKLQNQRHIAWYKMHGFEIQEE